MDFGHLSRFLGYLELSFDRLWAPPSSKAAGDALVGIVWELVSIRWVAGFSLFNFLKFLICILLDTRDVFFDLRKNFFEGLVRWACSLGKGVGAPELALRRKCF